MKKSLIEIWGDVVDSKELVFSIFIIATTTMTMYSLAGKEDRTLGLFLGLAGAVIGFLVTVYLFKPKRIIHHEEDEL